MDWEDGAVWPDSSAVGLSTFAGLEKPDRQRRVLVLTGDSAVGRNGGPYHMSGPNRNQTTFIGRPPRKGGRNPA